jgi:hypothetical protein
MVRQPDLSRLKPMWVARFWSSVTDAAAERLGVEVNWLRHHGDLPFIVRPSPGVVRYSSRGIDAWIAQRQGKGY